MDILDKVEEHMQHTIVPNVLEDRPTALTTNAPENTPIGEQYIDNTTLTPTEFNAMREDMLNDPDGDMLEQLLKSNSMMQLMANQPKPRKEKSKAKIKKSKAKTKMAKASRKKNRK